MTFTDVNKIKTIIDSFYATISEQIKNGEIRVGLGTFTNNRIISAYNTGTNFFTVENGNIIEYPSSVTINTEYTVTDYTKLVPIYFGI